MGCCGEKRKQWAELTNNSEPANSMAESEPVAVNASREFEYTGDRPLVITGAATGQQYHFRYKGDRLSVDYYDSFSMMAESELRQV